MKAYLLEMDVSWAVGRAYAWNLAIDVGRGFVISVFLGGLFFLFLRLCFRRTIDLLHYGLHSSEPPPSLRVRSRAPGWRAWVSIVLWPVSKSVRAFAKLFEWKPIKTLLWLLWIRSKHMATRLAGRPAPSHGVYALARLFIEATILEEMDGDSTAMGFPADAVRFREQISKAMADRQDLDDAVTRRFFALARSAAPHADIESCFAVFDHSARIRQYFVGLATSSLGRPAKARPAGAASASRAQTKDPYGDLRMLTRVTIQSGYLAPMHLVAGLLSNFNNDWPLIVRGYGRRMESLATGHDELARSPSLRRNQSFLWDCWIQWGPSIPICATGDWPDRAALDSSSQIVALQFGYGDENNSLPVFDEKNAILADARALWTKDAAVAAPTGITGFLCHSSRTALSRPFCRAQRELGHEEDRGVEHGRLSIRYESLQPAEESIRLYSAYLWVIVIIFREDRPLYDPRGRDAWRGMIPFFQHANVADPQVYEDLKRKLAAQAVDFLTEALDHPENQGLSFRYACSFDDNGTADGSPILGFPGRPIRELMAEIWGQRNRPLGIVTDADAVPEISSCHLPVTVRDYFHFLEREKVARSTREREDRAERPGSGVAQSSGA